MTRRIPIGAPEDFSVGKLVPVTIEGREFAVTRLPDGRFRVFRNACPHKGAPLCNGIIGGTWPPSAPGELLFEKPGEVLLCPWHGYEFDLNDGEKLYDARAMKLRLFPAVVEDGRVVVTL